MQVNVNPLPKEIWGEVLNYCSGEDLLMMGCVNKQFHELAEKIFPIVLQKNFFGPAKWLKHGVEIKECLGIPCKMWAEFIKANGAAMLTLIPKEIDGQPVDLKSFDKWLCMKNGRKTNYEFSLSNCGITDELVKKYQIQSDHWFLLFKGVPEETRNKPYSEQQEIVEEKGYEVPSLMGTALSILTHNHETGELVFTDGSNGNRLTYTRVEETS